MFLRLVQDLLQVLLLELGRTHGILTRVPLRCYQINSTYTCIFAYLSC